MKSRTPSHRIRNQSGKRGSNPRPSAWEANALPAELFPHNPIQTERDYKFTENFNNCKFTVIIYSGHGIY